MKKYFLQIQAIEKHGQSWQNGAELRRKHYMNAANKPIPSVPNMTNA